MIFNSKIVKKIYETLWFKNQEEKIENATEKFDAESAVITGKLFKIKVLPQLDTKLYLPNLN